jgi:hypothetical protein
MQIFDEINSDFPNGLGSMQVIGLNLVLSVPMWGVMQTTNPDIGPYFIHFPFTGSQWWKLPVFHSKPR